MGKEYSCNLDGIDKDGLTQMELKEGKSLKIFQIFLHLKKKSSLKTSMN